ncbi:cell division protein SepF [Ornithinicoccus hortensis]|uniref:Cell division protein SepF n=1 Tax=Ornithinicoccus hortensis TaxID=82346 RepID=A0A542YRJ6_9MICO|nr:cell division protein SepF [Ornithinicoccus hortensis]TQL50544.1 cell division inhibitor SepF [Ornithinicoccus hortensis]
MAGALRKTMEYLGLQEAEERYDDYEDYDDRPAAAPEPEREEKPRRTAEVTQLPQRTPVARVVRQPEVTELTRITTIHPRTYNEAKDIGEAFRDGVPVIMNLSEMADNDAKRLVDFAAGLAFGLHGSIERVTSRVFLISPSTVEVDGGPGESARAQQPLFNQS